MSADSPTDNVTGQPHLAGATKAVTLSDPAHAASRRQVLGPRVILIRHAHAKEGAKDPDRGHHLSAVGERQADALARRAAKWQLEAIICSDMYRACETAAAVHRFHPNVPLIVDATFREVSAGTLAAFEAGEPAQAQLGARLEAAWGQVVAMPYSTAAIVTHNGMIQYLLGRAIEYGRHPKPPLHSALTGISAIEMKTNGNPRIRFFNDTRHLTPELVSDAKTWVEDVETGRWSFGADEEHPQ